MAGCDGRFDRGSLLSGGDWSLLSAQIGGGALTGTVSDQTGRRSGRRRHRDQPRHQSIAAVQ